MPSLRRHIITGDEILFAPERAARGAWGAGEAREGCPFCPGNESMTPPEIARRGNPWQVRVFANKYPAVKGHEVIVETPEHDGHPDTPESAEHVAETYVSRYRAHDEATHVALFSNVGERAGASIHHPHSQLMPLSFVPPRVARESQAFEAAERCPLCMAGETHERAGLLISSDDHFCRVAPSGSIQSYEQWIVPVRHQASIGTLSEEGIAALASALRAACAAARRVAASYNVLFMNFRNESAHFYVAVIPRLSAVAGFELATGTFIDIIDPADAVQALR